jgi:hypothetical protein
MIIRFENRQAVLAMVLIGLTVIALASVRAANMSGMRNPANASADTFINGLYTEAELIATNNVATVQIQANAHSIARHGVDAVRTVDCYNRNGTWRVFRVDNTEFHLLCKDDDGSIRDVILERENNTSKNFFFKNAFTPKQGIWKNIEYWLRGKAAQQTTLPADMIIIVE